MYLATEADAEGLRRMTSSEAIDEAVRVRAQAFVASKKAVFSAVSKALLRCCLRFLQTRE